MRPRVEVRRAFNIKHVNVVVKQAVFWTGEVYRFLPVHSILSESKYSHNSEMFAAIVERPAFEYLDHSHARSFHTGGTYSVPLYKKHRPCYTKQRPMLLATAAATHYESQPALLKLLLENGADVREWDASGNTCLHLAIAAARPDQPWVVQSLTTLIHAGADPSQPNYAGFTTFDLACSTSTKFGFGSFRRDVLLQALLESGSDIPDERLLAPPRLTAFYTKTHQAKICGAVSAPDMTFFFRAALFDRLNIAVDCHNARLHEAAIDRVLSSDAPSDHLDQDILFEKVLGYFHRMMEGKKDVVRMVKERLSHQTWMNFGKDLHWHGMTDQARTAALLEFDWFRPVDPEDVFLRFVDNLIEQLEDLGPSEADGDGIGRLIEVLENAIPSYRAVSVKKTTSDPLPPPAHSMSNDEDDATQVTLKGTLKLIVQSDHEGTTPSADERERQESIVKTPVEYYRPELKFDEVPVSPSILVRNDSKDVKSSLIHTETKSKKWRWSTRRMKS